MAKTTKAKWPDGLAIEQRINLAKYKVKKLVDHLRHVIAIHESNKILVYSDALSKQIPQSYGAHTFNLLQDSQYRYELVRLCALWDASQPDRESIPTIVTLISDDDIRKALVKETEDHWVDLTATYLPADQNYDDETRRAIDASIRTSEQEFGAKEARKAHRWLKSAEKMVERVRKCPRFLALIDMRNHHVAHNLSAGAKKKAHHATSKYGDENWLLELSIRIVDRLNLGVCGSSFGWDDSRRIAEKQARAFWNGVTIEVLQ